MRRLAISVLFVCLSLIVVADGFTQQIGAIQAGGTRSFVTGFTPVIGPRGVVGGVSIDPRGVLTRTSQEDVSELAAIRRKAMGLIDDDLSRPTAMRMISLKNLDRILVQHADSGRPLPASVFFLAGLQRVEYVLACPETADLVLAGPAEGWKVSDSGAVLGVNSDRPVLRLDDLMDAMRSTEAARRGELSCSIDPSEEGLARFARLIRGRRMTFDASSLGAIENAMGPQRIVVSGVESDGHFARIMVAADYRMKSLAMGWEASRVSDLPSYLELIKGRPAGSRVSSPRWWLATNYEPIAHSPDRLAWKISGPGVKARAEGGVLDRRGQRARSAEPDVIAGTWGKLMTEHYDELSVAYPVFGSLRNCVDLSVVAALIRQRDLVRESQVELNALLDSSAIRGPMFVVAKQVDSRVSSVKARSGWIVTVSGGVEIDSWSVLSDTAEDPKLDELRRGTGNENPDRWWW